MFSLKVISKILHDGKFIRHTHGLENVERLPKGT